MSTSARKQAARRVVLEQAARQRRRRVNRWTTAVVVVLLVAAGLVGWAVRAGQGADAGAPTPAGAVDGGTAFARGDGPVTVDLYEDFLCPVCKAFEQRTGPALTALVDRHEVTVRYHPIAILDGASAGTRYSTRAASAAAAAAVGGRFLAYHDALYAAQPAEGSPGLDDAKLVELGAAVGLTGATFADAVRARTYGPWAARVTDAAAARGVTGTPTVLVNGRALDTVPTPEQLTAAVAAARG